LNEWKEIVYQRRGLKRNARRKRNFRKPIKLWIKKIHVNVDDSSYRANS
jgi:hypothetical protein